MRAGCEWRAAVVLVVSTRSLIISQVLAQEYPDK